MTSPADLLSLAQSALSRARAAGADAADAIAVADSATSVSVRLGQLEHVERSEGVELGLRVFVGTRSASIAASELNPDALTTLAERAVAMARMAPEDRWAGLAPQDRLLSGPPPALDLDDGGAEEPDALKARALAVEAAAMAVPGVTNSEGGSASAGHVAIALATSHGFAGGYRSSSHGLSASVLAGAGSLMQRDAAFHGARHASDLESAEMVGRRAGERAVARLNPVRIDSGAMPVLFDPRVGSSLISHLIGSISGAAIARRTSFLLDALGTQLFAPGIRILDDPLRPRGLRSRPFDGEGLPVAPLEIVADGVLTTWLLDSASARQLGLSPTGHAARGLGGAPGVSTSNLHLAPGTTPRADMIGAVKRGIYVTHLIGQGVNGITGDYSRGAAGFLIEDGEIGPAVDEITIAGNLKAMFAALTPADDLEFRTAINVPTLRVDGMTVASG